MSNQAFDYLHAFQARGIIGRSPAVGEFMVGYSCVGDPYDVQGIYQIRHNSKGQYTQRMRSYRPTNPRTVAQQANRSIFADAMSAWVALTDEEKQAYNQRARKIQLFGKNLFIREYYQSL